MYGRGDILRIDLSSEKITRDSISPEICRLYTGGEGINVHLFWEHFLRVDPGIDPVSPENVIVWGLGPLGGTSYGGGSKSRWTFKSPAYGLFGDSTSGGAFGTHMRWAGFDHLVITGRARRPVYILIRDDDVELRDASRLQGKKTDETNDALRQEIGEEVETACIGPAGENMVGYASITVSSDRSAGRTGAGCVFGSKNLKAIAVHGTRGISVYKKAAFFKAMDALLMAVYAKAEMLAGFDREHFRKYGTLGSIVRYDGFAWNAYRNNQDGRLTDAEKVGAEWYFDNLQQRIYSCSPGCAAACQAWHHIKGNESPLARRYIGRHGTRPEYGSAVPFGVSCDIEDLPAVAQLCDICNQYSLDIFEAGMTISLLMELCQRGIITPHDIVEWMGEPLSIEWGNCEAVEKLLEAAAFQKNEMGRIMKGGVYKAANRVEELKGVPVLQYANYGKGGATHIEAMRSRPQLGFLGAVSMVGAHHSTGIGVDEKTSLRYFGAKDAGDNWSYKMKGVGQALGEVFSVMYNSLGVCKFGGGTLRMFTEFPPELYAPALFALTGQELTPEELVAAGWRVVNLQKAFNSRLGLRREHDTVCHRWMNQPTPHGPGKGMKVADFLEQAKDEYYEYHGWDKATSLQKREKLEQLGLKDVADLLEKEGALAK